MTENMIRVLEQIYRSEPQGGYAQHKTALALERAGLAAPHVDANPPLIRRGDFPRYWMMLTDAGRRLCEQRFGPAFPSFDERSRSALMGGTTDPALTA